METVYILESTNEVIPSERVVWSPEGYQIVGGAEPRLVPYSSLKKLNHQRLIYVVKESGTAYTSEQIVKCLNGYVVTLPAGRQFYSNEEMNIEVVAEPNREDQHRLLVDRARALLRLNGNDGLDAVLTMYDQEKERFSPPTIIEAVSQAVTEEKVEPLRMQIAPLDTPRLSGLWMPSHRKYIFGSANGILNEVEIPPQWPKPANSLYGQIGPQSTTVTRLNSSSVRPTTITPAEIKHAHEISAELMRESSSSSRRPHDPDIDLEGSDPVDLTPSIPAAGFPGLSRLPPGFPKAIPSPMQMARLGSKVFPMTENPYVKYCPSLFTPMTCPKRPYQSNGLFGTVTRLFPGFRFQTESDWRTFGETPLFFLAERCPDDWEDLYGEPFSTRANIYAYVKPDYPNSMKFYSEEELITSFLKEEDFVDPKPEPGGPRLFTSIQMNCFLALLESKCADSPLVTIVRDLRASQATILRRMRVLSANPYFKECLSLMLEIAMRMRGWKGEGNYPLRGKSTHNPVDHVVLSQRLLQLRENLDRDWIELRAINLVKYKGETWSFEEKDSSLSERLAKVMNDGVCIRQTSAVFAWTVWYYFNEFFKEPPFSLSELADIV